MDVKTSIDRIYRIYENLNKKKQHQYSIVLHKRFMEYGRCKKIINKIELLYNL